MFGMNKARQTTIESHQTGFLSTDPIEYHKMPNNSPLLLAKLETGASDVNETTLDIM